MDSIKKLITEMELPLLFDRETLGGGNCGFHALIQQGKRAEVDLGVVGGHMELRAQVCNYALTSKDPKVIVMKKFHDDLAKEQGTSNWEDFFNNMKKKGVWMHGPVLPVAALYLNFNINVISQSCKETNPWYTNDGGEEAGKKPSLFLANAVDKHFQSLLPTTEVFRYHVWDPVLEPFEIQDPTLWSTPKRQQQQKYQQQQQKTQQQQKPQQQQEKKPAEKEPAEKEPGEKEPVKKEPAEKEPAVDKDKSKFGETIVRHNIILGQLVRNDMEVSLILAGMQKDEQIIADLEALVKEKEGEMKKWRREVARLKSEKIKKSVKKVKEKDFFSDSDAADGDLSILDISHT